MKVSLFWFRHDLRLKDNTALQEALRSSKTVLPLFIFDENILDELELNDPRLNFIYDSLKAINDQQRVLGSSLVCKKGKAIEVWKTLINEISIDSVYINRDYEPYALKRDNEVREFLQSKGIRLYDLKDQVIFEKSEIVKQDGCPIPSLPPIKINGSTSLMAAKWKHLSRMLISIKLITPSPLSRNWVLSPPQ